MTIHRTATVAALIGLAALAGCNSSRMSSLDSSSSARAEPLEAAPSGTVTSSQLPAPTGPTDPSAFPAAPTAPNTQVAAVDPAAADPAAAAAAATGPDVSKGKVVGSWGTSSGGSSCQMFLTLTKYGNGSRGGTRGCSGELAAMRGWDVQGRQLVLYNDSGATIARLYSSAENRFDGQTSGGQPVSITR